ncbi:MAG: hypothetical protein ACXVGB_14405 [Mycobacteriaceae bacterium]
MKLVWDESAGEDYVVADRGSPEHRLVRKISEDETRIAAGRYDYGG